MGRVSEGNFAILGKALTATTDNETRGLGNPIAAGNVVRVGRMAAYAIQSAINGASM